MSIQPTQNDLLDISAVENRENKQHTAPSLRSAPLPPSVPTDRQKYTARLKKPDTARQAQFDTSNPRPRNSVSQISTSFLTHNFKNQRTLSFSWYQSSHPQEITNIKHHHHAGRTHPSQAGLFDHPSDFLSRLYHGPYREENDWSIF